MTDYISRADAIEAVQKIVPYVIDKDTGQWGILVNKANVITELSALPSADAVHGEWIIHGEPPWLVRECSKCGTKWHQWSGDKTPNYCGNCGARMKGGAE